MKGLILSSIFAFATTLPFAAYADSNIFGVQAPAQEIGISSQVNKASHVATSPGDSLVPQRLGSEGTPSERYIPSTVGDNTFIVQKLSTDNYRAN